jgi:hypothetical protein
MAKNAAAEVLLITAEVVALMVVAASYGYTVSALAPELVIHINSPISVGGNLTPAPAPTVVTLL